MSELLSAIMDIHQLSTYLGLSEDTIYRYAIEGTIPSFKLGNRWRFRRAEIDAHFTSKKTKLVKLPNEITQQQIRDYADDIMRIH